MLKMHDFILLKAIFDEKLYDAVLSKDAEQIEAIIHERYSDEIEDGFVSLEALDVERLHNDHQDMLKNDNFDWAL